MAEIANSLAIRSLSDFKDQLSAREIFDETWAMDSGTEITPNLLQAMVHSGSYLSGAFIDGKCVGAALHFQQQLADYIFTHI